MEYLKEKMALPAGTDKTIETQNKNISSAF